MVLAKRGLVGSINNWAARCNRSSNRCGAPSGTPGRSDDTTLLGRLNCTAAGFICNRYGFMGPSYAVSAACATSLVALYSALQMIRNGIIDAAIVGGGEDDLTHLHFLEFSA